MFMLNIWQIWDPGYSHCWGHVAAKQWRKSLVAAIDVASQGWCTWELVKAVKAQETTDSGHVMKNIQQLSTQYQILTFIHTSVQIKISMTIPFE